MPTGGGKSLCYQLPSLLMDGTAIVISPLIALMKNQVDAIRHMSQEDGIAHYINSSLNRNQIEQVKNDITSGVTKLLYVAPESLTKETYVEFLKRSRYHSMPLTRLIASRNGVTTSVPNTAKYAPSSTTLVMPP